MTTDEAIQKVMASAEARSMSGDEVYFCFLLGIHERARQNAEELASGQVAIQ